MFRVLHNFEIIIIGNIMMRNEISKYQHIGLVIGKKMEHRKMFRIYNYNIYTQNTNVSVFEKFYCHKLLHCVSIQYSNTGKIRIIIAKNSSEKHGFYRPNCNSWLVFRSELFTAQIISISHIKLLHFKIELSSNELILPISCSKIIIVILCTKLTWDLTASRIFKNELQSQQKQKIMRILAITIIHIYY